jgi:hypothetical protein
MRLRRGNAFASLFAIALAASGCARTAAPQSAVAVAGLAASAGAAERPSEGGAPWPNLDAAVLLDRGAARAARERAFETFQRDGFERVAGIVRRGDSKGADAVIRGLCAFSLFEGARAPMAPADLAEWTALRALHRADGDEGGTLALLELTEPSEATKREREAVLGWVEAPSERAVARASRRAKVAFDRAALCPTTEALASLEQALRAHLEAAVDLRSRTAVMTPEQMHSDEARDALRAFTAAPVGLLASKLARGDLQGAKALAKEPAIGAFLHPAILEALGRGDATPSATEYAALALTLRIVAERDSRHREPSAERLVEIASARLAREAQVLQPTAPETTLLAARVLAGLALGAVGVPVLAPVATQTREHEWLREALLVALGAEGEAAARADRRDVERIVEAGKPVFDAVAAQKVEVDGLEPWRAGAMAGEAALRDGDGAAAEARFRSLQPTPIDVELALARLEAAGGHASEALARIDRIAEAKGQDSAAERAVFACEIASFAALPDAQGRCTSALDAVLGGRALWTAKDDGKSDRLLARVLVRFEGGLPRALAALDRAFAATRKAGGDPSFVVGQAIGAALAADAPDALGRWIERAQELEADDLAYFGAWAEALLTRHGRTDDSLRSALRRAQPRSAWVRALHGAVQAKAPRRVVTAARVDAERAEVAFYTGLEAWARKDDSAAREHFVRCRAFRALDLMEHGFSEALLSGPARLALPKDRTIP